VSQCQKRTSGLYGAREDCTEADTQTIRLGATPSRTSPPFFYRPDALPAAQPTVLKLKALKAK